MFRTLVMHKQTQSAHPAQHVHQMNMKAWQQQRRQIGSAAV